MAGGGGGGGGSRRESAAGRASLDAEGGERRRYLAQLRLLMLPPADQLVLADLVRSLPGVGGGLAEALGWAATGVAAGRGVGRHLGEGLPEGVTVEVRATGGAIAACAPGAPSPGAGAGPRAVGPGVATSAPAPPPTSLAATLPAALHRQFTAAQLCIAARDRLVVANLLLVERVVAQVVARHGATPDAAGGGAVPPADLVQEGALALVRATATYDPSRGVPFVYYAGRVVQAGVVRAVENHSRLVRLPVLLLQRVLRVQRAAREVEAALAAAGGGGGRGAADPGGGAGGGLVSPATAAAVTASVLGIPRAEVERLARLAQAGASLDATFSSAAPVDGGGGSASSTGGTATAGGCLLDTLESPAPLPEQAAADAEAAVTVRAVMERLLDAEERTVMARLYGLCLEGGGAAGGGEVGDQAGGGGAPAGSYAPAAAGGCGGVETKAAIGRNLGWSRAQVRIVERRALSKMRRSELRGYRDVY